MKQLLLSLAFASCIGCTRDVPEHHKESAQLETDGSGPVEGQKEAPVQMKEESQQPIAPAQEPNNSEDLAAVVEGNNQFAFDLYHQLGQKPGNNFFSPYSVSTALGMTYAGARGNTAKEMAETLHFTLDNQRLHPAYGELIRKIQGADKKRNYELAVANSLWGVKTGLSLDPTFLGIAQTDYQAGFRLVDFANDAEGARRSINGWVEDKTHKKIEDLIPKGLITNSTRLVLVNAIYFKGDWSVPFPKSATKPDDFTIPGEPAFKVPMMNHTFGARYMENADFQLAQFMYKDDEVSMVVILPKKKDGLPETEKKLSAKALAQSLALASPTRLQVAMPMFKMTEEFSLAADLAKLGMQDAFLPGVANFTRMDADASTSLFISTVVHKAFVEINEKGTEAAGATGVILNAKSGAQEFRADHPFLFVLRHNATGSILFMGRVIDPRGR
jgi:serpin B